MSTCRRLRVLVVGATGMLGATVFRMLYTNKDFETLGTIRSADAMRYFKPELRQALIPNINLDSETGIVTAFSQTQPDVVINCVGIIKQLPNSSDHLESLLINACLPHRLAKHAEMIGARIVHFSTDCVFSGYKGNYTEKDFPDASDLYGRTKLLGEVDYENSVTLRTSIIGHELTSTRSLVDWFLSQEDQVKGYRKAIFSGLPTIEVARIVSDLVIPNLNLRGLYHLSAHPISKYELLCLISEIYGKAITINPDDQLVIDRSLNSDRFRAATGFNPRPWYEMIKDMHTDKIANTI
jgi:dTDP-4-dehydrorhamnose reductase